MTRCSLKFSLSERGYRSRSFYCNHCWMMKSYNTVKLNRTVYPFGSQKRALFYSYELFIHFISVRRSPQDSSSPGDAAVL